MVLMQKALIYAYDCYRRLPLSALSSSLTLGFESFFTQLVISDERRLQRNMKPEHFASAIVALLLYVLPAAAQQTPCDFDATQDESLARCLLRPVRIYGNLGPPLATLPTPLDRLIGHQLSVTREDLLRYLRAHGVREEDVGGPLSVPLASTRYFVVHDTSSPYLGNRDFPADINEASWSGNNLSNWVRLKVTNVYVNRLGDSATAASFDRAVVGTKYERDNRRRRGLFVHVEMIQPRRRDPRGGANNDALAPAPGFTQKQLERLALLYVAASVRRGRWLLPAFHASVDAGIHGAHDDPQNFDMSLWLDRLRALLEELGQRPAEGVRAADTLAASADDAFNFPEPNGQIQGRRLTLWATHYYVHNAEAVAGGQPLLDINGRNLGVSLSVRDWCLGAVEGTIRVTSAGQPPRVFNYAGRARQNQLDCSDVVPHLAPGPRAALGKSRFEPARGPFGTGVQGMFLVPYRTIAVDAGTIPFGTVIYIPDARGRQITLPDGRRITHDGYFYAADTGGAIRGSHIDVFGGIESGNPFPSFIKSRASGTFTAFVINDSQIAERLKQVHTSP